VVIYIAYAALAVLLGVVFWFIFAWHDVKVQRDDAWARLAYLKADADAVDWYAKRALEAEARVKELEAQLNRIPRTSVLVPSCWVSEGTALPTTLSVGGTGIIDTVFIDTLAKTVLPTVAKAAQQ
jgi:hypothetical protein